MIFTVFVIHYYLLSCNYLNISLSTYINNVIIQYFIKRNSLGCKHVPTIQSMVPTLFYTHSLFTVMFNSHYDSVFGGKMFELQRQSL